MTRVVLMAGVEPRKFLYKGRIGEVRIVIVKLQAGKMIGNDIVDPFNVVGLNAYVRKHEAVRKKPG